MRPPPREEGRIIIIIIKPQRYWNTVLIVPGSANQHITDGTRSELLTYDPTQPDPTWMLLTQSLYECLELKDYFDDGVKVR